MNRRERATQRAARLRAEREAADRRRRLWVTLGVAAGLVVLVAGSVLVYRATSATGGDAAAPSGATGFGYQVPADAGADAVEVVVYEDFICPACQLFEQGAGAWLAEQRDAGEVVVDYRPVAFLDDASTTEYSTRAANAAACVADDAGLDAWVTMHDALFAEQPPEGGPGLDDARLAELAEESGADEAAAGCVEDGTYADWVAQGTDAASDDGVTGTPTVVVDGERVEPTQEAIEQAVAAAAAG